jgi:hypothetical protein
VATLAVTPRVEAALQALSLERGHVASVFEAITTRGVSPRGAVALGALVAAGVPLEAVHAMRAANLVELRHGNSVDGHEYAELAPLVGAAYVCAPCPLARESMVCVAERLRTKC